MRASHKLTDNQIAQIVAMASTDSYEKVAQQFQINKTTVGFHVRKAKSATKPPPIEGEPMPDGPEPREGDGDVVDGEVLDPDRDKTGEERLPPQRINATPRKGPPVHDPRPKRMQWIAPDIGGKKLNRLQWFVALSDAIAAGVPDKDAREVLAVGNKDGYDWIRERIRGGERREVFEEMMASIQREINGRRIVMIEEQGATAIVRIEQDEQLLDSIYNAIEPILDMGKSIIPVEMRDSIMRALGTDQVNALVCCPPPNELPAALALPNYERDVVNMQGKTDDKGELVSRAVFCKEGNVRYNHEIDYDNDTFVENIHGYVGGDKPVEPPPITEAQWAAYAAARPGVSIYDFLGMVDPRKVVQTSVNGA